MPLQMHGQSPQTFHRKLAKIDGRCQLCSLLQRLPDDVDETIAQALHIWLSLVLHRGARDVGECSKFFIFPSTWYSELPQKVIHRCGGNNLVKYHS
jgi:hypothetical protein